MSEARRGQSTKERLLEEACKVFAEKGYRDATHAEICRRAGANSAAINYYFTSKENLYQAVFERLEQEADALYPLDGGLPPESAPEKRLRAFIHAHLSRMFDPGLLESLHRIRMAEMFDPTGLLSEPLKCLLAQHRAHILRILSEFLGPQASLRDVEWCEMSIVSQCLIAAPGPNDEGPRALFKLTASETDRLTNHILAFSLAGIEAIRQRIEQDAGSQSDGNEEAANQQDAGDENS